MSEDEDRTVTPDNPAPAGRRRRPRTAAERRELTEAVAGLVTADSAVVTSTQIAETVRRLRAQRRAAGESAS